MAIKKQAATDPTNAPDRYWGTSQDTKPNQNVRYPSLFIEQDSGNVFFWDDSIEDWVIFGEQSGGGGMENPMSAAGDIIIGGDSGTPTRLAIGSNGKVLKSDGTTLSWQNESGLTEVKASDVNSESTPSGKVLKADGLGGASWQDDTEGTPVEANPTLAGTESELTGLKVGNTKYKIPDPGMSNPMTTVGDVIIAGANGAPTRLGVGASGKVLKSNGTTVSWQDDETGLTEVKAANVNSESTPSGKVLKSNGSGGASWQDDTEGTHVEANPTLAGTEDNLTGLEVGNTKYKIPDPGMTNPMSAQGDIIVGGSSGAPTRLAKGANGKVLKSTSNGLAWADDEKGLTEVKASDINSQSATSGKVLKANGSGGASWEDEAGGGMSNPMTTEGDIIVGGVSGAPTRLAKGSIGKVLKVTNDGIGWDNPPSGVGEYIEVGSDAVLIIPQRSEIGTDHDNCLLLRITQDFVNAFGYNYTFVFDPDGEGTTYFESGGIYDRQIQTPFPIDSNADDPYLFIRFCADDAKYDTEGLVLQAPAVVASAGDSSGGISLSYIREGELTPGDSYSPHIIIDPNDIPVLEIHLPEGVPVGPILINREYYVNDQKVSLSDEQLATLARSLVVYISEQTPYETRTSIDFEGGS